MTQIKNGKLYNVNDLFSSKGTLVNQPIQHSISHKTIDLNNTLNRLSFKDWQTMLIPDSKTFAFYKIPIKIKNYKLPLFSYYESKITQRSKGKLNN